VLVHHTNDVTAKQHVHLAIAEDRRLEIDGTEQGVLKALVGT
jgi:hypothetical protein